MRKITLLLCTLVVSSAMLAQNPKQLWTSAYSWNTTNRSRDIALYDGKIYVTDNNAATSAVHVLDAATGAEIEAAAIVNENFQSFGLTVDDAGHLLLPKNTGGASSWILSKVDLATGTVTSLNGGTAISAYRTDFIEIKGNIESADHPAYIIGASTNNPQIQAWEAKAGDLTATAPFVWTRPAAAVAADIKWIDDTHILLTQQSIVPVIYTVDFATPTNFITEAKEINSPSTSIGGGDYFVLENKPYIAIPTGTGAQYGTIGIFDISDAENPVAVGEVTPAIGSAANAAYHLGIEALKTADNKVIIYVWSPNNGAAAYEFTSGQTGIKNLSPIPVSRIKRTAAGIEIGLDAVSVVELYAVNGALIDRATVTGSYVRALSPGVYIVRVNGKAAKFVK